MTNNEIILRRVAASLVQSGAKITKSEIRKRIKGLNFVKDGNGYETYDQRVDAVYNFANEFSVIRSQRNLRKNIEPPIKNRQQRLFAMKKKKFMACVQRVSFRQTKNGNHLSCVQFVDTPDQVKAISWEGSGGIRTNDKRVDSEHRYFIMSNWTTQVENRGLAILDGKLTLCANKLKDFAGVEVFQATWVSQGEGCTLKTNYGHIARNGEYSAHGETADGVAKSIGGHRRMP